VTESSAQPPWGSAVPPLVPPLAPTEPTESAASSAPGNAPRTSRARAITRVVLGLAAVGVLIGGLWGWIAPPIHAIVAIARTGERVHDFLGTDSQHFFVAPTLMIGLLTVVAVVAPVLLWQWREQRGPAMVIGLVIGLVTAAAVAAAVGAVLVRLRFGDLNFDAVPLSPQHKIAYVIEAPPVFFARKPVQVAATLLWPAGTACLIYAVFAAASARDDLGGLPAPEEPSTTFPGAPKTPGVPVAPVQPEAPEGAVS
jgi:hypothetical protein